MDADEYQTNNIRLALLANEIEEFNGLDEMLEAQSRAEAIGPFLDPTAFIRKGKALRIDSERTRIVRDAQNKLKKLRVDNEK